ncbi:MAG: deoxyguanosinetriphosphate triphosphohydrolase [Myxococcota bacterium]|nr:deoxyguanosinetriphosphate triphosphohydrolase [Myxococcota bacterium]
MLRRRRDVEQEERERLAPYAQCSGDSAGRAVAEPEHAYRTAFSRDRDRIVHSRAFRRLEYKTQVFVYHEGDHYRTRLTHTLEGSQIARSLARALRANEELAEAIVLAHDLGHTPFGHAGEDVLDELMSQDGGFDHNRQTLRVVDLLERRYPDFPGLNLTAETRLGILKHGCDFQHPVAIPEIPRSPSIEAQIADCADEIAYLNHDLDDGLRSGLITLEQLADVAVWARERAGVELRMSGSPERVLRAQTIRALIDLAVTDLLEASEARLRAAAPKSPAEVSAQAHPLVGFSEETSALLADLKKFLYAELYRHPRVVRMSRKAQRILRDLFGIYRDDPRQLPRAVLARFSEEGEARAIADYVAGMTDRFALAEHRKLLDPHEPV